jgi:hypothetical protein
VAVETAMIPTRFTHFIKPPSSERGLIFDICCFSLFKVTFRRDKAVRCPSDRKNSIDPGITMGIVFIKRKNKI